jgi:hypothetical protein
MQQRGRGDPRLEEEEEGEEEEEDAGKATIKLMPWL